METRVLIGGLAILFGAVGAVCAIAVVITSLRRRRVALAVNGERSSVSALIGWRLRNGFGIALPVARRLLAIKRVKSVVDEVVELLKARGVMAGSDAVLSVLVVAFAVLFIVGGILTGGLIAAVALVLCAVALIVVLVGHAKDKREDAIREEVPNALESMSACFGSGFTLLQTFEQVAKEVPGALGDVFANCAHILETGGSAEEALRELREGAHASELAFVAVALDVQHQNGGTLKQVLDAASDSVKGELALRRSLRVQTAQAKLSARVVVVMPFVLIAAFSLASPDFLSPFFSSVAGYALLGLAIIMQVGGILLVRRALAVDGVS